MEAVIATPAMLQGAAARAEGLTITRVFNAPRQKVWDAFTRAEELAQWWGPKGFTMKVATMDLRPGGTFHYGMVSPAGHEMWGKFTYTEVEEPDRISFVVSFSDEHGGVTRHPLSDTWPLQVYSTVTLTEHNGKTTLTQTGGPINASEEEVNTYDSSYPSMQAGFKGTFDQLDEYLARS